MSSPYDGVVPSPLAQSAIGLHEMVRALEGAGFTRVEAIQMATDQVNARVVAQMRIDAEDRRIERRDRGTR